MDSQIERMPRYKMETIGIERIPHNHQSKAI